MRLVYRLRVGGQSPPYTAVIETLLLPVLFLLATVGLFLLDADRFRQLLPSFLQLAEAIGLRRREVLQLGAIFRDVVQLPRPIVLIN